MYSCKLNDSKFELNSPIFMNPSHIYNMDFLPTPLNSRIFSPKVFVMSDSFKQCANSQNFHAFQVIIRDFCTSIAGHLLKSYATFHHYTHFCLISLRFIPVTWKFGPSCRTFALDRNFSCACEERPCSRSYTQQVIGYILYPELHVDRTMAIQTELMIS